MADFFGMYECTQHFMSLWRSYKPTIARVHGPAVAGGSDIALCCDLVDGREVVRERDGGAPIAPGASRPLAGWAKREECRLPWKPPTPACHA